MARSVADAASPLGRMMAIVGQLSGSSQADRIGEIVFTRGLGLAKDAVDERNGFISRGDLLAYHPKMGR
jgi:hypothetical protein